MVAWPGGVLPSGAPPPPGEGEGDQSHSWNVLLRLNSKRYFKLGDLPGLLGVPLDGGRSIFKAALCSQKVHIDGVESLFWSTEIKQL